MTTEQLNSTSTEVHSVPPLWRATFDGTQVVIKKWPFTRIVIPLRSVSEVRSTIGKLTICSNDGRMFEVPTANRKARDAFAAAVAMASAL